MRILRTYWWIPFFIAFAISMFSKPALCPVILGSIFVGISVHGIYFLSKINKEGLEAIGTIENYVSEGNGHSRPIISFTTLHGEQIQGKPHVYTSTTLSNLKLSMHQANDKLQIIYIPGKPTLFVVKSDQPLNNGVFMIFIIAGLAFIAIGIASMLGYISVFD